MDKVNSIKEAAAQKFAYIYFNPVWEKEKYAESIKMLISFQEWQQSQTEITKENIEVHVTGIVQQKGNTDSDVVEFVEWLHENTYTRKNNIYCLFENQKEYTVIELFKLYKNENLQKNKNI